MNWEDCLYEFEYYIKLEKNLSQNTLVSYVGDVVKFKNFMMTTQAPVSVEDITREHIQLFIQSVSSMQSQRSQARILSSLRSFFEYLQLEKIRKDNPTELIESPKLGVYLPEVLSLAEINAMIYAIDLSTPLGERNKTILETLYGLGLRVSELTQFKLSNIFWKEEFIQITGKGGKQRLVPLGKETAKYLRLYIDHVRSHFPIHEKYKDFVFLNRRGKEISRVMVFNIIKEAAKNAGVEKNISPHTLRHSFATHLIENGADLISIQQMLGHESITTTEIYTHLDQNFLRETLLKYHPRSTSYDK